MKDKKEFYAFIGKTIRDARKSIKMRQKDFGNLLGISRTSIVNIEAGRQNISLWQFFLISRIVRDFDFRDIFSEFASHKKERENERR